MRVGGTAARVITCTGGMATLAVKVEDDGPIGPEAGNAGNRPSAPVVAGRRR